MVKGNVRSCNVPSCTGKFDNVVNHSQLGLFSLGSYFGHHVVAFHFTNFWHAVIHIVRNNSSQEYQFLLHAQLPRGCFLFTKSTLTIGECAVQKWK